MTTDTKEKPKARGLGKGLSALMGEASYTPPTKPAAAAKPAREGKKPDGMALTLPLEFMQPSKYQPREFFSQAALLELADSIRSQGLVQPLVVRELERNKYEIIAGERRWRAARMAGMKELPVIVRVLSDKQALETAIVENVQREDLNPLEEAAGYQRLMTEFSYTQEQLATSVTKSRSYIANLLRLLELPEEIRQFLMEDRISMGHARALAGIENNVELAQEVVEKGLSVRQTEKLVRRGKEPSPYKLRKQREKEEEQAHESFAVPVAPRHEPETLLAAKAQQSTIAQPVQPPVAAPVAQPAPPPPAARPAHRDPDIVALEETLSENLGLKVSINDRGQAGEITVSYDSLEQLDDILRRLGGSI